MKRIFKIILIGLAILLISYWPAKIIYAFGQSHSFNKNEYKKYLWLFKASVKKDFNLNCCYSYLNDRDVYSSFLYKQDYFIEIWELKDLSEINLESINIDRETKLNDITENGNAETIGKGGNPEVQIGYGFKLNNQMNVNFDQLSTITKNISESHYKGFLGVVNRMSFENEDEVFALFDYVQGPMNTLLLFYKKNNSFYMIKLDSKQPVTEDMINMFNLD